MVGENLPRDILCPLLPSRAANSNDCDVFVNLCEPFEHPISGNMNPFLIDKNLFGNIG
jgi:hypothetical protein